MHLRPAEQDDRAFLASLFRDTRPELAKLPAGLAAPLLQQQQRLQESAYRGAHPRARELIIESGSRAIGRVWIDAQPMQTCIVELSLAAQWRGQGLGTELLRQLQAGGKDLVLSVAHDNAAARRLYLKLGFVEEARDEVRAAMRWRAQ